LMQHAPARVDLDKIRTTLRADVAVTDIAGLHVWALDDGVTVASVSLSTSEVSLEAVQHATQRIRIALSADGLSHVTVEWQPVDGAVACCLPHDAGAPR
jgi:cobalt-zinc-cadmium efflux system protein